MQTENLLSYAGNNKNEIVVESIFDSVSIEVINSTRDNLDPEIKKEKRSAVYLMKPIEVDRLINILIKARRNIGVNLPSETKKKRAPTKKFVKPTIEEIATYCSERKNSINPSTFFNHYQAIGWVIGKSPIKDWQACVHTWENRDKSKDEKSEPTKLSGNFFN